MESQQDLSSTSQDSGPPVSPAHDGKLQRIASHTQGLITDLREWIDLRIDLAVIEVEERVDEIRNDVALGLTLAFLGFFAVLFGLTTVALGLGWLLGHPFWGFLLVSGLLILVVVALRAARPALMPPSNLFERVRGEGPSREEEEEEPDRPTREPTATVGDQRSSQEETTSSS